VAPAGEEIAFPCDPYAQGRAYRTSHNVYYVKSQTSPDPGLALALSVTAVAAQNVGTAPITLSLVSI
jgi:hypothetical protein